ncbi:MAG: hypothetical protein Q4C66_16705 [Lachnospiraceae bacterium]|nr:hypothetical protein [Lachnospiraceae bacterium]
MDQLPRKQIDIYEEKILAERAYNMYLEGGISFPRAPLTVKPRKVKKVADILEEVLMGLPLPPVYVSEMQDGKFLVLDASDMLRCLFDFFAGRLPCGYMELYPELEGNDIQKLEDNYPRITSALYHYPLQFYVIDYLTPKYLHMQVGNHVANWNFSREQGVRNALYGGRQTVRFLERLAKNLRKVTFFSSSSLNRQYAVLRILMYRLIIWGDFPELDASVIGLQMLLDQTFQILENGSRVWLDQLAADIMEATDVISQWNRLGRDAAGEEDGEEEIDDAVNDLLADRGKEQQMRKLGYFYNTVWLCQKKGYPVMESLTRIGQDDQILDMIENDAVNNGNIVRHWEVIGTRL